AMPSEGTAASKRPLKIELLDPAAGQPPQATVPYGFRPREHKLVAGDELKFVAVAEDNRTSLQTRQPEPNSARTQEQTLVIVPPAKKENGQGQAKEQPMGGQNQKDNEPRQPNQKPADKNQQNPNDKNVPPEQPNPKDRQPPQQNDGGQNQQQQPSGGQQQ